MKTKEEITILAWQAWEQDQKTNPKAVNPHAFAYGYLVAYLDREKRIAELEAQVKALTVDPVVSNPSSEIGPTS